MIEEGIPAPPESVATSGYAALVLDRLAKQTCQLVESAASSIFARDRRAPGMTIAVAACGLHEEIVGSRFRLPDGFGEAGPAWSEARRGLALGAERRRGCAGATLPACWDGQMRGALAAEAAEGCSFGVPELDLLGELATTAGAALEHAERREHALRSIRSRVRELVQAIDGHDGYTAGHSEQVVEWSCMVGERLRLSMPDLLELELGALLHDLGKVRVPEVVLGKPGALDRGERTLVNRHPAWGAELLESVPGLEPVATIVRFHHERWDGTGYPDGLWRDRIPVASRIIAVCDAYQAMTSDRAYRSALPPAAAASQLCAGAGTQFDPAIVDCFVAVLQERGWPLGPVREPEAVRIGGTR
jgi:HD-GYP domain-containing protein (c-di-GMP phosphodiesterase class II)